MAALFASGLTEAGANMEPGGADRVVLVVNSADPDSARIAQHYARVRQVPEKNIYAFAMPRAEEISRGEFVRLVWQPLQVWPNIKVVQFLIQIRMV